MKRFPVRLTIAGLTIAGLATAIAATIAFAAPAGKPREITFQKLTLTGEYWCDGVNAANRTHTKTGSPK